MQGRKTFEDERQLCFSLSAHVPAHNFYRRLKDRLDLSFLYELTAPYYGRCGQKSIDPVVFFKLCLVGYLENIASDRKLIEHCSLRLDLLYFLDYQLDEPLPWHSTVSRTRQLLPTALFEEVFTRVLSLCADAGMVSGHTQAVDSALIKANASMGSLELKVPQEQLEARLQQVRTFSSADRSARHDKAPLEQRTLTASQQQLHVLGYLHRKWRSEQNLRPGGFNKGAKYTSNKTHYSPVDPDARIAVKLGKARRLCYHLQLSVDASRHVITHVLADHADRKDSRCLPHLLGGLTQRLGQLGLRCTSLLADTGYSSGENYALLERGGIAAFIPAHGKYRNGPEGFTYHREGDFFLCPEGKIAAFRQEIIKDNKVHSRLYRTTRQDCRDCPLKASCCGKLPEKRIAITSYRDEYERTITRTRSRWGRRMKRLRQATVEPVLGTQTTWLCAGLTPEGYSWPTKGCCWPPLPTTCKNCCTLPQKEARQPSWPCPDQSRRSLFASIIWLDQEIAVEKGIEIRRYARVVQQAHSSCLSGKSIKK